MYRKKEVDEGHTSPHFRNKYCEEEFVREVSQLQDFIKVRGFVLSLDVKTSLKLFTLTCLQEVHSNTLSLKFLKNRITLKLVLEVFFPNCSSRQYGCRRADRISTYFDPKVSALTSRNSCIGC